MHLTIWTIGHSTRTLEEFIRLLTSFNIALLADIRMFPGSKRYPHFNKEALETSLLAVDIMYEHFPGLGGRRKPRPGSTNTAWRNTAFRGYADYMETSGFKTAIEELQEKARSRPTAMMCSEAVWWRCHRSLVSDYLKINGWTVLHIMDIAKFTEHPERGMRYEV